MESYRVTVILPSKKTSGLYEMERASTPSKKMSNPPVVESMALTKGGKVFTTAVAQAPVASINSKV